MFEYLSPRAIKIRLRERLVGTINAGISSQLGPIAEQGAAATRSVEHLTSVVEAQLREIESLHREVAHAVTTVGDVQAQASEIMDGVRCNLDQIPDLRGRLSRVRTSEEYQRAFTEDEPLVTVRIATYNGAEILMDRTIPSVLNQTYQKFEIVVVGDGCTDDTSQRIEALGDPRIKFVNRPIRGPYPENASHRWLVAGSPAMNLGIQLAKGLWIAPLDHDDEFLPNHIEVLLRVAREGEFELAYGRILQVAPDPKDTTVLCRYPPESHQFGFQAAIHLSALRFFEYNTKSWLFGEPGDWNLCRRMLEAGVRIGWVDEIVTRYYPSQWY